MDIGQMEVLQAFQIAIDYIEALEIELANVELSEQTLEQQKLWDEATQKVVALVLPSPE